jgi:UDP-N-acetylmuramoyl-tripeptide--D-alanyl-D-alanine ligase
VSGENTARNRASFTVSQAAQATQGRILSGDASTRCLAVSSDTRTIAAGDLFVALRGERFDAHQFLPQAKEAGALAAVVENAAHSPQSLLAFKSKTRCTL